MRASLPSVRAPGRAVLDFVTFAVVAAFTLAGAARAQADAFDRPWCELDAGSFRLVTDHEEPAARTMVRQMNAFRQVAEGYLPGTASTDDPALTVVVFERSGDFRRAIRTSTMLGYMQPSFGESLMVVGPDPNAFTDSESLLHEYVHYLLRTRTGLYIPTWFDEGLAGTLATMQFTPADAPVWREAIVGELAVRTLSNTIHDANLPLRQVLDGEDIWEWPIQRRRAFYAWSHVLVHRLTLGQQSGRSDYRDALADTLTGDQAPLTESLGMSAAGLQRELERYLQHPSQVAQPIVERPSGGGAYRCLDEDEAIIQISLAIMPHNPEEAARQLARRIDVDPDQAELWNVASLAQQNVGDRDAAVAAARRALELAPGDVSARVQLANSLSMGCIVEVSEACWDRWREAVPLLRQALRIDPRRQDAIFTLGLAYLYTGRPGDALNYLRIAHQRQPWAAPVNFYLGESYRLIGDGRAGDYLDRARRWSPTELWRALAEAALAMP